MHAEIAFTFLDIAAVYCPLSDRAVIACNIRRRNSLLRPPLRTAGKKNMNANNAGIYCMLLWHAVIACIQPEDTYKKQMSVKGKGFADTKVSP